MNGNESEHGSQSQTVFAVFPDGTRGPIQTVSVRQNLPYMLPLGNQSYGSRTYSPAISAVTVGYDSPDGNVYVPYI